MKMGGQLHSPAALSLGKAIWRNIKNKHCRVAYDCAAESSSSTSEEHKLNTVLKMLKELKLLLQNFVNDILIRHCKNDNSP
jgi:hypothetical protein